MRWQIKLSHPKQPPHPVQPPGVLHKGSEDSPALALECPLCHQSILVTCCDSSTSNAQDVLRISSSSHLRGSSAAQREQNHSETTCVPCEILLLLASGRYSDRTGKAQEKKPSYDWSANWLALFTEIHRLVWSEITSPTTTNTFIQIILFCLL